MGGRTSKRLRRRHPPDAQSGRIFDAVEAARGADAPLRPQARSLKSAERELYELQGILVTMEQQRDAAAQQLSRVVNSEKLLERFIGMLEQLDKGLVDLRKTVRALSVFSQED